VGSAFKLTCQNGPAKGTVLDITGHQTVGRDVSCAIVLEDPKVSRVHGFFTIVGEDLHYKDNGSTNGSFLNGERVIETVVQHGDVLKIGSSEFALLEDEDFRTINIVSNSDSAVTGSVSTAKIKVESLAEKFSTIFDFYKKHQPDISDAERYELMRTQRLLGGLKTIFGISQTMTKLVPLPELLPFISKSLFEVFPGAENLVILLKEKDKKGLAIKHAAMRDSDKEPAISISRTVLDRAVAERCTLIANDAAADSRLSHSDSIIGFSVKSVMCAPLVSGENVLGALYLDNRRETVLYDELDAELVTAFANQCAIAIDNSFLCDTLQAHYLQTLQALVNAIEAKDAYTMGHTARVSRYSCGIARHMGFNEKRLERLRIAADLHDIGKIGIKEGIINKTGKLTDTEYHTIQDHVTMGEKILQPITFLQDVLPFIRGHHEKWDGTGYPDGLKGDACPLEGRIIALADAFDAMTSQRSYNKPLTFSQAWERISEARGRHFDPDVVDAFGYFLDQTLYAEEEARKQGHDRPPDTKGEVAKATKVTFADPKTSS
jgi:putative nucleotidyltransferase with HDIG domain